MKNVSKIVRFAAIPALCLGLGGFAYADGGYVMDGTGVAVRDMATNGCVRTGYAEGAAPAECGGMVAAAEPAPAPVAMRAAKPVHKTTLESKALFDTNKSVIKPAGRSSLDKLVREIKSTPDVKEVHVVGYTDIRGTKAHNQVLSEHRAQSVKTYLTHKGVHNVTAEGRGIADPVGDNKTAAGRAMNRRVEVEVR